LLHHAIIGAFQGENTWNALRNIAHQSKRLRVVIQLWKLPSARYRIVTDEHAAGQSESIATVQQHDLRLPLPGGNCTFRHMQYIAYASHAIGAIKPLHWVASDCRNVVARLAFAIRDEALAQGLV
jgi:hypothetical protein